MNHTQNLVSAFAAIGVTITDADVADILQGGADKFISAHSCPVNEESLAGIYIIMTEAKQAQPVANDL